MDKIKRLIEILVPVQACNFRCHYCYITHRSLFVKELPKFDYSPEHVAKAFSKERLGGVCVFNFCGEGETLLPPEVPSYMKVILQEGHYITLVTNASASKRFDEISDFGYDLCERLFFKFSFHYLELKKKNLMDKFFENIDKMKKAGCSYTIEITPSDELIPYIDEIKELCMKRMGTLAHITVARDERVEEVKIQTNLTKEEYINTWSTFSSKLFDFKMKIFGQKRKEFCYAGDWSFIVNLGTGEMSQCYCSFFKSNIFENINKSIPFRTIGNRCSLPHCWNGHSFLNYGNIPELKLKTTCAELRNRIQLDGTEWLTPKFKYLFTHKLEESNEEYSELKKFKANLKNDMKVQTDRIRNKFLK